MAQIFFETPENSKTVPKVHQKCIKMWFIPPLLESVITQSIRRDTVWILPTLVARIAT